jgi:predicted phosphodiesterase
MFDGVRRVLLVGDSHANRRWWMNIVVPAALEQNVDAIIQLGDFGWWPNERFFRNAVANSPVPVWFLDGNHEHFPDLKSEVAYARKKNAISDATSPVPLLGSLGYLPRGARFTVDGVTFAVAGGAHSIDRGVRRLGESYFLDERLTDDDVAAITTGGHADVLLCHDAPSGWIIPGLAPVEKLPLAWRGEQVECEDHRELLRRAYEALTPTQVVHGHYHRTYSKAVDEAWGTVFVDGLNCDGAYGSLAVFEVVDGTISVERIS